FSNANSSPLQKRAMSDSSESCDPSGPASSTLRTGPGPGFSEASDFEKPAAIGARAYGTKTGAATVVLAGSALGSRRHHRVQGIGAGGCSHLEPPPPQPRSCAQAFKFFLGVIQVGVFDLTRGHLQLSHHPKQGQHLEQVIAGVPFPPEPPLVRGILMIVV